MATVRSRTSLGREWGALRGIRHITLSIVSRRAHTVIVMPSGCPDKNGDGIDAMSHSSWTVAGERAAKVEPLTDGGDDAVQGHAKAKQARVRAVPAPFSLVSLPQLTAAFVLFRLTTLPSFAALPSLLHLCFFHFTGSAGSSLIHQDSSSRLSLHRTSTRRGPSLLSVLFHTTDHQQS
nr:hypothetical protein CFP56_24035 [Quercus suber]